MRHFVFSNFYDKENICHDLNYNDLCLHVCGFYVC